MALTKLFQILMFFRILSLSTSTTDCFCYTFNTQRLFWADGRNECRKGGGDLVTMETEEKWQFINSKIQHIHVKGIDNEWCIGLEKKGGQFRWVNNQTLTINKWQRNEKMTISEPNNDGKCVAMAKNYPTGTQGLFKDVTCFYSMMYICEFRKGNPRCKYGYYPPRCNETNSRSTTAEPTRLETTLTTATQPFSRKWGARTTNASKTISTSDNERNVAGSTVSTYITHHVKNKPKPFLLSLVAILIGVLLAVFICLFLVICFWRRKTGTSKDGKVNRKQQPEMAACFDYNEVTNSTFPNQITDTGAVVYADIQDGPTSSSPGTTTYAEVHGYVSPRSIPMPEYLTPCDTTEQNKVPAYQPDSKDTGSDCKDLDHSAWHDLPDYPDPYKPAIEQNKQQGIHSAETNDNGKDDVTVNVAAQQDNNMNVANERDDAMEHAHQSVKEDENGGPKIARNEHLTVSNAVYATDDKSKNTNTEHKEVEAPVYAQINRKSAKAKASSES